RGTPGQKQMLQEAFNRWWWPTLMMFGPSDKNSTNSAELMRWKVKLKSNDDLRQRFINMTIPQALQMGLTIPDPDLKLNEETGNWETGSINWDEFKAVISGNGPCNRERLNARRQAKENGRWVREAAEAFARKQEQREAA
ncbi:MAG: phenylacetate-CoA oxygenase subunit PaaI, partial [Bdellovibrionales bacterium]|nr:phenylacetate-CoA oxygenase subunit PaaI [Bdellovibrionales bacterium]